MSVTSSLALLLGISVLAFVLRATPIIVLSKAGIPEWLERTLGFVGPAALASLVVNFAFGGAGDPHIEWFEAVTLLVAFAVAVVKRNLLVVLAVSMPVLWILSALA